MWGHIGKNGVVLEPSFEIYAPAKLPSRTGPYAISATDSAGNQVFAFSFDGEVIDHLPGERHFAFVIPMRTMASRPAAIRLTANGRVSLQRRAAPTTPVGITAATATPRRLSNLTPARSRLQWDAKSYPMALVRDAATGQIISFARGGQIDFTSLKQDIEVTYSDGVQSVRSTVRIPR